MLLKSSTKKKSGFNGKSYDSSDVDEPFSLQAKVPNAEVELHVARLLRSKDSVDQRLSKLLSMQQRI